MKYKIYLLFLLVLLTINSIAQQVTDPANDPTRFVKVVPPSPDASSLGKFGEYPLGKYNGIPEIDISLFNISQNDISLPISLSYHAGGIKVEENSGWTGLGWALNAGGIIARTMVGKPDESQGGTAGYLYQPYDIKNINSLTQTERNNVINAVNNGTLDLEPDVFTFNILGRCGKFYIDKTTQRGVLLSKDDILIKSPFFDASGMWEIIDEKGFKYKFQSGERNLIESESPKTTTSYTSSWYLTEILSPAGNKLTITYQDYKNEYYTRTGVSKYTFKSSTNPNESCGVNDNEREWFISNSIMGKRVASISFNNGTIKFVKSTALREDMLNDYYLQAIELYDTTNKLVKRYDFYYSYFDSNNSLQTGSLGTLYNAYAKKRLRLDSLKEGNGTSKKKPYIFQYVSGGLASVYSNSQDHWGYYNGRVNTSLVPLNTNTGNQISYRNVDFSYASRGTLNRIIYPTGGNTTYEYESNDASITKSQYFTYFYPYGPPSSEYIKGYSVSTNDQRRKDTLYVDSSTVMIDKYSNFKTTVRLPTSVTCDGSTKDCVESLEVTLTCIDCIPSKGDIQGVNLLAGKFVNGVLNKNILLTIGRKYVLEKSGIPRTGVTSTVSGSKVVYPTDLSAMMNIQVGGLRVKRVTESPTVGTPIVTSINYNKKSITSTADSLRSSGALVSYPNYEQSSYAVVTLNGVCDFNIRSSNSKLPLMNTGGGPAGYSFVETVKQTGNEKQLSVSTFASPLQKPDNINRNFPYTIVRSNESSRGKLLSERSYSWINSKYYLVKIDSNEYVTTDASYSPGVKMGCIRIDKSTNGTGTYVFQNYNLTGDWVYLKKKYTMEYKPLETGVTQSTEDYFYTGNLHRQLSRKEQFNSKGEKIVTQYLYPTDYATGTPFVDAMKTNNMVALPLEVVSYIEKGATKKEILNATAFTYKDGGKGLKNQVLNLEFPNSLDISIFKYSNKLRGVNPTMAGSNTAFSLDGRYREKVRVEQYDEVGNILQFITDSINRSCYLWDYTKSLPITEVTNSSAGNVAYTSFEADGKGNLIFNAVKIVSDATAPIGKKCYTLGTVTTDYITKSGLTTNQNYILSYWVKTGTSLTISGATLGTPTTVRTLNGWTMYSRTVSNATAINVYGSGFIDDIRLYPLNAQMTTYTYDPLVGMTSAIDAKGQTTYYEYDSFGRLKYIKDADGNILTEHTYNYKQ